MNSEIKRKLNEEMTLKGFTKCTKKSYEYNSVRFLKWIEKYSYNIDNNAVKKYVLFLHHKKYDVNTIRQIQASIAFLFKSVFNQDYKFVDISRPKKKTTLPKTLTKNEIKIIIESITNKKHKLVVEMLYSSGLRVSELVNLKREDIDLNNNSIYVKQGKGKKDRVTILSETLKISLLDYIMKNQFKTKYLFEGRNKKYSIKSVQEILKKHSQNKHITPHMLRHSFATHLLDDGIDIRYIQQLLGHSKLNTTQIYTKISNKKIQKIKSPLDTL